MKNKVQMISAKKIKKDKIFQKQVFQKNLHKILNKFPQINHKSFQEMKIITQFIQWRVKPNNHNNQKQSLHQVNLVRMVWQTLVFIIRNKFEQPKIWVHMTGGTVDKQQGKMDLDFKKKFHWWCMVMVMIKNQESTPLN